ncbi:MAG TPA: rhodanese-like domain-containing protein [Thermomicrobiales bacterium]|nr:rhodanese-like domain-containing protein [Thermomicrobiales bacterium]
MSHPPRQYPCPDLIVEPAWLAAHLGDTDLLIIDCDDADVRAVRPHIPGAVPLPIHPYLRDIHTNVGVLPPDQATMILGGLGVGDGRRVVCYDSQGGVLAARCWWVLWYYGFENAALLNGGWISWAAEGNPVEHAWGEPVAGDFVAQPVGDRIADCDVILPRLGNDDFATLDMRTDLEWAGTPETVRNQREGYIPGAVHLEWKHFVDWEASARFKPALEIATLLESNGITRGKAVVPY